MKKIVDNKYERRVKVFRRKLNQDKHEYRNENMENIP